MRYTFQKYLDISTSASSVNIISIHAGGKDVLNRTKHLFGAYKYFKLGGIKIKLVPASTLPVDPAHLSYTSQDVYTIDPRDQLNPGLVRITNGENMCKDLSGVSEEAQQIAYTNTMLDPRWSKFMLQSGFSRYAYPLYYNLGEFAQADYPDWHKSLPVTGPGVSGNPNCAEVYTTAREREFYNNGETVSEPTRTFDNNVSSSLGLHQVGHRGKLGWLSTDSYNKYPFKNSKGDIVTPSLGTPAIAPIPSIEVLNIILPKAHKTIYYYRLFITETIYFKGLKNTGILDGQCGEIRGFDNFLFIDTPKPAQPVDSELVTVRNPSQPNNGGGIL